MGDADDDDYGFDGFDEFAAQPAAYYAPLVGTGDIVGAGVGDAQDAGGVSIYVDAEDVNAAAAPMEDVAGARYRRMGRRPTAAPTASQRRSVFEELNIPVPAAISLPPARNTLFDVPLSGYGSRPWEVVGTDISDYFNYGLQPSTFTVYAANQARMRDELTSIDAARKLIAPPPPLLQQALQPPQPQAMAGAGAGAGMPGFGYRSGTRSMFKRGFRDHGRLPLKQYLRTVKVGDYVDVVANSSIHKGMPHKFYHGRTGVVFNVTKVAVGVEMNKVVRNRVEKKRINLRVEHVRPSQCRVDFLKRVNEVDAKLRKAKAEGIRLPIEAIKRFPVGPRAGYVVQPTSIATLKPIAFDDML